tara:strand:+ start:222 stop:1655 length:1434 start_codon:yes stop_codon:yes gene_type:complete
MSKIEVNEIVKASGSTLTIGGSGTAVTLGTGATQTGFGRSGAVDWQTGDIKTSTFTAESGKGYFVNTTSTAITVNLPAGSAGAIVGLKDYAGTWDSNAVTLNPNGSENIGGGSNVDPTLNAEGGSILLVYVDGTQGWLATQQSVTTNPTGTQTFNVACGGNATVTCGNYRTHIFTSPGTITFSSIGDYNAGKVDYLVVAGGGGGGSSDNPVSSAAETGGAGAGGFRSFIECSTNPLNAPAGLAVTATGYPITIGAGGAGKTSPPGNTGGCGSTSTFHSITSAGGGGGPTGFTPSAYDGQNGGSGSGGGATPGPSITPGGTGNTPPVTPPQGNNGGTGQHVSGCWAAGGGGGGAGAVGVNASATGGPGVGQGGCGGAGSYIPNSAIGPTAPSYGETGPAGRYFAGGGGGGSMFSSPTLGLGGLGGGGDGASGPPGAARASGAGTTNTGSGAGGQGRSAPNATTGNGGSGIVMIRYRYQ